MSFTKAAQLKGAYDRGKADGIAQQINANLAANARARSEGFEAATKQAATTDPLDTMTDALIAGLAAKGYRIAHESEIEGIRKEATRLAYAACAAEARRLATTAVERYACGCAIDDLNSIATWADRAGGE